MKIIGDIIHQKNFPLLIFNSNGYQVYVEHSIGFWSKRIYDSNGNILYYEDSDEYLQDHRL